MVRQAIYFLPEAIRNLEKEQPGVQVIPLFQYDNGVESFLKDESDVLFFFFLLDFLLFIISVINADRAGHNGAVNQ